MDAKPFLGHPVATLKNGVVVLNFSSDHPFQFCDGTLLEACPADLANRLGLQQHETKIPHHTGKWVDYLFEWKLTTPILEELDALEREPHHITLAPLPLVMLLRNLGKWASGAHKVRAFKNQNPKSSHREPVGYLDRFAM